MNNKVIKIETWWVLSSHNWKGRSVGRATQKKTRLVLYLTADTPLLVPS